MAGLGHTNLAVDTLVLLLGPVRSCIPVAQKKVDDLSGQCGALHGGVVVVVVAGCTVEALLTTWTVNRGPDVAPLQVLVEVAAPRHRAAPQCGVFRALFPSAMHHYTATLHLKQATKLYSTDIQTKHNTHLNNNLYRTYWCGT